VNGDGFAAGAFAGRTVQSPWPLPQALLFASMNEGSAGFITSVIGGFAGTASGLTARDITRDGKADVEALQTFPHSNTTGSYFPGDATVHAYFSKGDGTFAAGPGINLPIKHGAGLSAADFNGDGSPDFAVAGQDARPQPTASIPPGAVAVISGMASNATTTSRIQIFRTTPDPLSQLVADANGDHRPDIITGHSGNISTLLNITAKVSTLGDDPGTTDPATDGAPTASPEII